MIVQGILIYVVLTSIATHAVMNTRDSYVSAYMEGQTSTEPGVVYAEPVRSQTYGPPQNKPMHYGPRPFVPSPPIYSPVEFSPYSPLMQILMQLPEKLEFVPKVASLFLTATKILLKVVLIKLILKFIVMFCLFFFLPKLGMLDAAMEMKPKPVMATSNSTTVAADMPTEDDMERKLNGITAFVYDSLDFLHGRQFEDDCSDQKNKLKCQFYKLLRMLQEFISAKLQQ